MRIVLETLFNKIDELNKINNLLGCEKVYGIKFSSGDLDSRYDCFREVYTNLNHFIEVMQDETYIVNIENSIVEIMETARSIEDVEYEVTFEGNLNGQKFTQMVYAYLSEVDQD